MSTRALYTFKGETDAESWNVYKHHDGYPTGAASVIEDTFKYFAWRLPRYEADECAAAFCAAGKSHHYLRALEAKTQKERKNALAYTAFGQDGRALGGGGTRFMPQGNPLDVAASNCSDIEYRYEIYPDNNQDLRIKAFKVSAWDAPAEETLLFDCKLPEFGEKAEEYEKMQMAS